LRNWFAKTVAWLSNNKAVWITLILLLLVDRVTKRLTLVFLPGRDIALLPYLHLNFVQNTGAAFGMMQGGNIVLIVITLLILGYILINWKELCSYGSWVKWGLVLILGGALGNFYDRITLGFVVDFIDLRVWPVFNAADSFITIGGVMLAVAFIFSAKTTSREEKK